MNMLKNPELRRVLRVGAPLSILVTVLVFILNRTAGFLTAGLCLVLGLLYILDARKRYRTMARLVEDINAVLHGRTDIRFAHYTEGEVSLLRSELKKMTLRLTEQAQQLQDEKLQLVQAIADISHQLRTPLTTVNLLLAGLSAHAPDTMYALQRQVSRMDWLVNALLKLTRLDAGTVRFQPERVSLRTLIDRAAEPLAIPMELKGQTLEISASGEVRCDLRWTAEALGNILKNCTEHMGAGRITVTAEENAMYSLLRVRDCGSGIDERDLPHLFERYYKGANASEQSVGIGLALSRSIITAQNGTVKAANYDGGAEFSIKLYKGIV
ncbi:MAG: HAMP domain-containing histidine kinase [Oscillospiraceae bacterium]|jgi:signal transduction histidine kinase|nr:HAMP domain-containing histidine kinase [Oscillospiraceae bacterium]